MSDLVHSVAADAAVPAADAAAQLAHLADVVASPPPTWWPQTVGWPVAGGVLLIVALWAGWRWLQRYRADRYRRAAQAELARLHPALAGDAVTRADALLTMAALLKRTALAAWPREAVASLSGAAWCSFLVVNAGRAGRARGRDREAAVRLGGLVRDAEYRGAPALAALSRAEAEALADACRQWIASHRAGEHASGATSQQTSQQPSQQTSRPAAKSVSGRAS